MMQAQHNAAHIIEEHYEEVVQAGVFGADPMAAYGPLPSLAASTP
jgi:hypothetical protein